MQWGSLSSQASVLLMLHFSVLLNLLTIKRVTGVYKPVKTNIMIFTSFISLQVMFPISLLTILSTYKHYYEDMIMVDIHVKN